MQVYEADFERANGNIYVKLYGKLEYFNYQLAQFYYEPDGKVCSDEWFGQDWGPDDEKKRAAISRVVSDLSLDVHCDYLDS